MSDHAEGAGVMRSGRLSLRTKLALSFLAVIVMGSLLWLVFGSRLIRNTLIGQAQDKVRHDLNSARMVFNERLRAIEAVVRLTAARESLRDALVTGRTDILWRYLGRVRSENGLDILNLLDSQGRVLVRTRTPDMTGDGLSEDMIVRRALERQTVAAPRIMTREALVRESPEMAEQALIEFVPTPMAAPREGDSETSGMVLEAASPVIGEDGTVLGVLTGGTLLNRDYEIVDRVKEIVFKDELYKGRETGTATIFLGDVRISTNVKSASGDRAIGTRLSETVKRAVLDDGKTWLDRAFVVNDWYITAYEPIRDLGARIIGILYVGMLEKPYLDTAARVTRTFALIAALSMAFLFILLYLSTTRIIRPLQRMAVATRQIARGDLSHKVEVSSHDEIGELADSFNLMTEHLREANVQLVEWGRTLEKKVEERTQELREIQGHLVQSEKLASIGKLAAGIAHEINNPLGGILIYSHLILEDTPPGRTHHENLKKIVKETTRCKDIVKGLLDFARPKEPEMSATDIPEILDRCLALMERQALFQNIRIEKYYAPALPSVIADGGQLQQVFMNIILNAAESMNGQGTLGIRVTHDVGRDELAAEISDSGHGIREEDKGRLFEPFFTTKEVGKGTGLGLAISYGIVRKHRGSIEVQSEVGQGARFTVRLPVKRRTA
jgi:two-component system NtrC family sensor kinase